MFRFLLPAALCLSLPAMADSLSVPGLSPPGDGSAGLPDFGECLNTRDADNCARTLACIGKDGLWFDGQVRGWNSGILVGALSDGTPCGGTWRYRQRLSIADARIECRDGTTAKVIYYSRDSLTGTGIGRGLDSHGRVVRVWSGEFVEDYLTPEGKSSPELPCSDTPIPIS